MRKTFQRQRRFGCRAVKNIKLNLNCRDEIIPILAALQHVYSQHQLRGEILALVAADVNRNSRDDCGREGLSYWQIGVLADSRTRRRAAGLQLQLRPAAESRRRAPHAANDHGHRRLGRRHQLRLAAHSRQRLFAQARDDRTDQPPHRRRRSSARAASCRNHAGRFVRDCPCSFSEVGTSIIPRKVR